MLKHFLITIDTEGDNQWNPEQACSTQNAAFLPRFQELCEKYDLKPTWLTNYEMAKDPFFVEYIGDCLTRETCEVGMHLHAWNNPPEYPLGRTTQQRDYLFEYPVEAMEAKVKALTELLEEAFQRKMVSHRSGRWATDENYFRILKKYGYRVDCSVTPYIDWTPNVGATGKPGSDYSRAPVKPYFIHEDILELPVTIRPIHMFCTDRIHSPHNFAREVKRAIVGRTEWLRPNRECSAQAMKRLANLAARESDYLMFMLHSSEMMPGGSPSFPGEASIDRLFACMEDLFAHIRGKGYLGSTLSEYDAHFRTKKAK